MPQLKVENLYNTTITSVGGIPSSGDCDFTVAVAPENTNGFIIISPDNPTRREIMYYHDVVGNRIYVRGENRVSPKAHIATETVKMNDVAEIFNTFSDMISQAFYVEKTGGLNVRVWGGYVYYNGLPVSVPDANLTMTDNTTNYIKYDYPSNTFSVDVTNSGNIKAQVITIGGAITSIGYRTAKESYIDFTVAITGALPPQTGNSGKVLTTDGTDVSWQLVGLRTGLSNNGVAVTGGSGNESLVTGTAGDMLRVGLSGTPIFDSVYFGDGSDGDVVISSNTTLTRDMYYANLTVNTGIVLNPNGYAIYVSGTTNLIGTAKIARNGNAASGQTGGAALNTGTCGPILGGVNGAAINTNGTSGVSVNPSYATTGLTGATGGGGGNNGGLSGATTGGTGGTSTRGVLYNTLYKLETIISILIMPSRAIPLATTAYGALPSSGSGGGGAQGNASTPGVGGGSGGNGGIIIIYTKQITGTGTIEAIGGAGGVGANATGVGTPGSGGGGGGGGGNGGIAYIVYRTGTVWTRTLTGGAGGAGGATNTNGFPGTSGASGISGESVIIQV